MNRWSAFLISMGLGFSPAIAAVSEWRSLADGAGGKLEVRFEGKQDDQYLLRRKTDGKLFQVSPDLLLPADRAAFDGAAKRLDEELAKLNTTAGHVLFTGMPFESRPAEQIAKALQLRTESSTRYSQSWRLYASRVEGYRLFGAMPYSVALYADTAGNASSLSVVFANKGDFGSKAGTGEEHFEGGTEATEKTLADAMKRDEAAVSSALTQALGPGESERFGEGKARRTIKRWNWNGHSLLLSSEDGEYVSLLIVPLDFAEGGGRTARMKDGELRDRLRESVVREENGDVYLSQIPMVNQGPKGYCVPATFERAMRTMGVEADMYLLAMIGESKMGGGTSVEKLLENVRSAIHRKGRRTRDDKIKELRIRDVKRHLDDGIPVMWTMMSVPEYNKAANENTAKRKSVTDWSAYAKEIAASAAVTAKQDKPEDAHHICMIVGYNEATDELAVSDSWGPSFERRWVPAPVANWASQSGLFMILP
jgi:hypothetical protein